MGNKFILPFAILSIIFLAVLFIFPKHTKAIDLEQVVAQSQSGDKVLEISGDQFYAYPGNSQIGEPPAPSGWKTRDFNDSSWSSARDAYEVESERANRWCCQQFPTNCRPLNMTQKQLPPIPIRQPLTVFLP